MKSTSLWVLGLIVPLALTAAEVPTSVAPDSVAFEVQRRTARTYLNSKAVKEVATSASSKCARALSGWGEMSTYRWKKGVSAEVAIKASVITQAFGSRFGAPEGQTIGAELTRLEYLNDIDREARELAEICEARTSGALINVLKTAHRQGQVVYSGSVDTLLVYDAIHEIDEKISVPRAYSDRVLLVVDVSRQEVSVLSCADVN